MTGRLGGRVAVVTGAARGIGRAVAERYAVEGARVFALDRLAEELDAVAAPIGARAIALDVASPADVARAFEAIIAEAGRIDVLANVAGIIVERPIEATSDADWFSIIGVNLTGTFLCCRAALPAMRPLGRGAIINTSSNAGTRGSANEVAYCASKFGVEGLSRALAVELAADGIVVNTVTPGTPVHTAMSETTYGAEQRAIWRDPADIAPAYVHLALTGGSAPTTVRAWDLCQRLANGEAAA